MVWQDERKGCRLFIGLRRLELVIGGPDRVETEGESFGRFLQVGSVKSSFAPPRKDSRNQGLRPSRNRRPPMGRLDSFRRRSSRNQALPAAAAKERRSATTRDLRKSLPPGTMPT